MSAEGKVIHEVSQYDSARYVVEFMQHPGAWHWDHHISTGSKDFAITESERLVRRNGVWEARVVDRDGGEDES